MNKQIDAQMTSSHIAELRNRLTDRRRQARQLREVAERRKEDMDRAYKPVERNMRNGMSQSLSQDN